MNDEGTFDFTEHELFFGLCLVLDEDEARRKAAEVVESLGPDMDWAVSEQLLLAISLGSRSGHEKVQRWRTSSQAAAKNAWITQHSGTDLERAWQERVAAENDEWEQKLRSMRQSLQKKGKLPPETT